MPDISDRIILGIVAGLPAERVARSVGVPEAEIDSAVKAARRKLTLAAEHHRDEQLGIAITRINECYAQSKAVKDVKQQIAAQKELNRLLDLYRPVESNQPIDDRAAAELSAIRAYLAPLDLAPQTSATVELARLAAAEIMHARAASSDL